MVNEGLSSLGVLCIPLFALLLPERTLWPQHWQLWLQLLPAIGVADLGITLMHWLSHHSALLWRLHAVHRSVHRIYGLNGLMKHPLITGTAPAEWLAGNAQAQHAIQRQHDLMGIVRMGPSITTDPGEQTEIARQPELTLPARFSHDAVS